ncbi:MAG: hypothetical protein ACP5HX_08800 [Thermoproteota archaeon]
MAQSAVDKELSIGEILGRAVSIYANNAIDFLIVYIGAAIITGGLGVMFLSAGIRAISELQTTSEITPSTLNQLFGLLASSVLVAIIDGLVNAIRDGAAVKLTSDYLTSLSCDFQVALSFVAPKAISIIVATVISSVIIVLGFLFLVVPGIIAMIMLALIVPVIVLENKGALDALGRSKTLVNRRWLKTFGVLLINGIIILFIRAFSNTLLVPFDERISTILSEVIVSLIAPITTISITLLYYSMLVKEKVLQQSVAQVSPSQPSQ